MLSILFTIRRRTIFPLSCTPSVSIISHFVFSRFIDFQNKRSNMELFSKQITQVLVLILFRGHGKRSGRNHVACQDEDSQGREQFLREQVGLQELKQSIVSPAYYLSLSLISKIYSLVIKGAPTPKNFGNRQNTPLTCSNVGGSSLFFE